VAAAVSLDPNPTQAPRVARLVANEQRLRRKLLQQLISKPGPPPEKTD
jgi:hypothetical protein